MRILFLIELLEQLQIETYQLIGTIVGLIIIAIVYRALSNSITRVSLKLQLEAHIQNSLRLILRILTILILSVTLFGLWHLPTEWFIGSSALVGAAVGFGSSQTINNIVAGFYVIISRPFQVKDFVKIGDVEGQVEEISINYTKLYTPTFNMILIPNVQIMNSRVLNCTHEGFIKYTFQITLPHSVLSNDEIIKKCIETAIEEFAKKHDGEGIRKPESYYEGSTAAGRTYKVRIFAPKGEAKTLYMLQSELANLITDLWDKERRRAGS
ncbi:MAG: mechanosensitive ion channel [Nitrososphaeria archaeon]